MYHHVRHSDMSANPPPVSEFQDLKIAGVNIVAPPMASLLKTDASNNIFPSGYAINARQAGLDIISWTTERSGRIVEDVIPTAGNTSPSFYYQTTVNALENDGDILRTIDVLARTLASSGCSRTGRPPRPFMEIAWSKAIRVKRVKRARKVRKAWSRSEGSLGELQTMIAERKELR